MALDTVTLNAAVVPGAGVACWKDAANREHQTIVLETQTASADPVPVSVNSPLPVGGNVADLVADAGNSVKVGGVYHTAPIVVADGQRAPFQTDASGFLKVNVAAGGAAGGTSSTVAAAAPGVATAVGFTDGTNMRLGTVDGSGNIKVNIAAGGVPAGQDNTAFTVGSTQGIPMMYVADNTNAVGATTQGQQGTPKMTTDRKTWVAIGAQAQGGWTPYRRNSLATTNLTSLKASAGQIGSGYLSNTGAGAAYVKLYDKASAPVLAADTPVQVYMIPAGSSVPINIPAGLVFALGIAFAITLGTGVDTDTNAVLANQVQLNLGYV